MMVKANYLIGDVPYALRRVSTEGDALMGVPDACEALLPAEAFEEKEVRRCCCCILLVGTRLLGVGEAYLEVVDLAHHGISVSIQ